LDAEESLSGDIDSSSVAAIGVGDDVAAFRAGWGCGDDEGGVDGDVATVGIVEGTGGDGSPVLMGISSTYRI